MEETKVCYYYAAISYLRVNVPKEIFRCTFVAESASGCFTVTKCVEHLEKTLEDVKLGSVVVDNVIEITEEDYIAYCEHCESLTNMEDNHGNRR